MDLDDLLKQLGQIGSPISDHEDETNETTERTKDLDALYNQLQSTPTTTTTTINQESPAVSEIPQPSLSIPDEFKQYKKSKFQFLPTKFEAQSFGYTGAIRRLNSFLPDAEKMAAQEAEDNDETDESLKDSVISKKPSLIDCEHEIEDIRYSNIGEKLEYKPHQFNEFNANDITYDEGKYLSIQKCVEDMEPYSTLEIPSGEYELDSTALQIKKPIYIKGIGDKVIIKSSSTACVLDVIASESIFENIRFISSQSDGVPSIRIMMNGLTKFSKCKFVGGQKQIIASEGKGYIEFLECTIKNGSNAGMNINGNMTVVCTNCKIKNAGFGILCQKFVKMTLTNCQLLDNAKTGLSIYDNSSIAVCGCKFQGNKIMGMEIQSHGENIYFEGNTFENNGAAAGLINDHSQITFFNNTINNHINTGLEVKGQSRLIMNGNKFSDVQENALILLKDKSVVFSEQDSFSGKCKIGVAVVGGSSFISKSDKFSELQACGFLVSDSGKIDITSTEFSNNSCPSIQATAKSEIQIRNSTFKDTGQSFISFGLGVFGKVVNCIFDTGKNCIEVMQGIKDFTFEDCTFQNAETTCVRVAGGTSPEFVNCVFKKSKFGAQCTNGCAPFFKYCNFELNDNACALASEETDATFIGCYFTNNKNYSIDVSQSTARLIGCKIKENKQIGLSALNSSTVELTDCILSANEDNGAQIGMKANVSMKNCRIEGHENKSGIFIDNAKLECNGCIFENNNETHIKSKSQSTVTVTDCEFLETEKGIAMQFVEGADILIKNCKISDQKEVGIISAGSSSIKIENTTIKNGETMGICMQKGSSFTITDCEISDIEKTGIFIAGSNGKIENCFISNCGKYGIYVNSGNVENSGCRYLNNGGDFHEGN